MLTASTQQLSWGQRPPDFKLSDTVSGKVVASSDFADIPVLVVMFICNHCPYVKHLERHLASFSAGFDQDKVAFVGISANDAQRYPEDSPDNMRKRALTLGYRFPYLYDESQAVAKSYGASCTPEFFVFEKQKGLVYHGRYDDSSPGKDAKVSGADLQAAIQAALTGQLPIEKQFPSLGCSIKWKK